ncbi:hypothetical protein MKX08_008731 [Trichoderma sp. CBMAI-0020]|nr:hypothetical protein MKX08_008731 [Trichoderma sp. CBMAI-0020]
MEPDSTPAEVTQSHAVPQQSPSLTQSNELAADLVEQEVVDENYIEGRLDIDEKRKRFDETSCTLEEKELSDLFKKKLLDDGSTGPLKGDFTLHDLPQLIGDEACTVQWKTAKPRPKKASGSSQKNGGETRGLTDDELASVLQACPDLEGFITKS